mmetsp:Transcript_155735/g.276246  ORF Transcript_155735/g.276246 Transcript_155735/m.276246 type:complete len:217 (+) Transcript_155735:456-1106(+)
MLAFKANKTIDHALEVVAQVWTGGVEGVHEQEALVGIEQATLHALAGSHSVLIGRANQLLHIRGDMCSAFPRRVGTIEAVLTEVVFALLTFDNCRLLLALLAHDDAVGLPDYINLVLLFAYLPEEINWIPKVNNVRRQIKLLLDVSLERLLHTAHQEKLLLCIYPKQTGKTFNYFWRRRRQTLGCAPHDLGCDGIQLDIWLLQNVTCITLDDLLRV